MHVWAVGEYLKRWGYTLRPRRHHRKQDPEEVKEWLETTYPALERKAQKEEAPIFWADETGDAAHAYPGSGYARKGERATMEVPDSHIRMNGISATSNDEAIRFMSYSETMNANLFLAFLKRLVRSVPGKIYLIVDRLKAHDAKKVW